MKTIDSWGRPIPKGFGGKEVGKLGGRPKGSQDKSTLSIKAAIHQTFVLMGGVPALLAWAKDNPTLFYSRVLPRLLPLEVTGPNGSAVIVEKIIQGMGRTLPDDPTGPESMQSSLLYPTDLPTEQTGTSRIIQAPKVFKPLMRPARYKGAHGGRGSGKSHFFAGLLIEEMFFKHTRAAAVREIQNSIKDSVKQLLEDKIRAYGLQAAFTITETEIRGPRELLCVFKGLQSSRAADIKSLERFTRVPGRGSADYIQTLIGYSDAYVSFSTRQPYRHRKMWFAWNRTHEKDPIEFLFRDNDGDPDFVCVEANYWDNDWFPNDLRRDMERDQKRDPDRYAHVWCGKYERRSSARVFKNWRIGAESEFVTKHDTRFYLGADWGSSIDPSVLIRCYIVDKTLFVDYEAYQIGCEIDNLAKLFAKVPGWNKWPIRADSARPEVISYLNRHGMPNIKAAIKGKGSVEEGIEFLQSYDIVVHPRCQHTKDELSFYSWKVDDKSVDPETGEPEVLPILVDDNNHVIDALRYAAEGLRRAPLNITDRVLARAAQPQQFERVWR